MCTGKDIHGRTDGHEAAIAVVQDTINCPELRNAEDVKKWLHAIEVKLPQQKKARKDPAVVNIQSTLPDIGHNRKADTLLPPTPGRWGLAVVNARPTMLPAIVPKTGTRPKDIGRLPRTLELNGPYAPQPPVEHKGVFHHSRPLDARLVPLPHAPTPPKSPHVPEPTILPPIHVPTSLPPIHIPTGITPLHVPSPPAQEQKSGTTGQTYRRKHLSRPAGRKGVTSQN